MFKGNLDMVFNQDLSAWDVSNVTNMSWMFDGAVRFNQDLSAWDVSNVTNMSWMFHFTVDFNQDISTWDVSNVTNMSYMFDGLIVGSSFNQDLSAWDVSQVNYCYGFSNLTDWTLPKPNFTNCTP